MLSRDAAAPVAGRGGQELGERKRLLWGHDNSRPAGLQGSPPRDRRFPIRAANGRVVAEVVGGVLRKRIQASRHFLRQPPAIAFDLCVLAEAERLGASQVEVLDQEGGRVYAAPLWAFERWGLRLDRGFGRQVALRLERWAVSGPGQPVVRQLQLFGESF